MNIRIGLAALASLTVAVTASAGVEWTFAGRKNGNLEKILSQQTGTNAVKKAGPNTLVFHTSTKDNFVESLKLDFTGMHPYGYYMVKRGNDIALVGPNGSDYACFDFLKRFTGYRSFGGGDFGEVIPKIDRIDLPAEFTYREEPSVASVWVAGDAFYNDLFARAWRRTCVSTHALSDLVPEKLYAEHPEYFPLIDGKRRDPASGAPWNPCMSNPDLPDLVRAYAERYFKKNPKYVGLPLGVNDGGGDCCCEKCLKLRREHGNQYLAFYNMAAKLLAKEFPGKLVSFIAYMSCANPPKDGFRMEPNILVEKTGHACSLDAWRKAGIRHFGNYQYLFAVSDSRMAPAYYPHVIARYLREYHRNYGLTTFWEELYPDTMIFDAGRQYVINELLWNMDADVDALIADYHEKMFGPAAKAMRKFSDTCEKAFVDNPERGESFIMEWNNPVQFNGWTFARIAACDAALKEAAAAAKPGSREAHRIDLIAKYWTAMRLLMDCWQCHRAMDKTDDLEEVLRLARRGLADIKAFDATTMAPEDEVEVFYHCWGGRKGYFKKWKKQTESGFAPLPPLERGIDGAFGRLTKRLGKEKAKAIFEPMTKDPEMSPYAVTQLYLMDNEPVNLVVNGSFEETCEPKRAPGDDKDWNPLGAPGGWVWWRFPNTEARAYVDDSEAHTGKRCGCLVKSRFGCAIMNKWKAEPRTRYRMSCWVKTNRGRGTSNGDVCVRLKNGKGEWIDVTYTAIKCYIPQTAVGQWVEISLIFTTPDREDGINLVPIFSPGDNQEDGDRLWIDDVRLEKLCELKKM